MVPHLRGPLLWKHVVALKEFLDVLQDERLLLLVADSAKSVFVAENRLDVSLVRVVHLPLILYQIVRGFFRVYVRALNNLWLHLTLDLVLVLILPLCLLFLDPRDANLVDFPGPLD